MCKVLVRHNLSRSTPLACFSTRTAHSGPLALKKKYLSQHIQRKTHQKKSRKMAYFGKNRWRNYFWYLWTIAHPPEMSKNGGFNIFLRFFDPLLFPVWPMAYPLTPLQNKIPLPILSKNPKTRPSQETKPLVIFSNRPKS